MDKAELRDFLNEKAAQYQNSAFFDSDPIQIPARFQQLKDIEISAFLTATLAWGNRKSIIKNCTQLIELMDNAPSDFIQNFTISDLSLFKTFVHRTFNFEDLEFFLLQLQKLYRKSDSLEVYFKPSDSSAQNMISGIMNFRSEFLGDYSGRTTKHLANPEKGSTAKRINMFLRWMVRTGPVDFGVWKTIPTSILSCPLDVHSGRVARKLNLLHRKANDQKAVIELDKALRLMDPKDPVKYDFALFGLGVFEKF